MVVAFGQIIPKSLLDLPPCGCINVHPSLLPKYRGAAPIQWALINGEKETGITIMLLDESEDTGDIILLRARTHPAFRVNSEQSVWLDFDEEHIHLFDPQTEHAIC